MDKRRCRGPHWNIPAVSSTLKSMPMVAVADSGSKTSSQYLVNTETRCQLVSFTVIQLNLISGPISHVLFPAEDGPIMSILSVGIESSEAMIPNGVPKTMRSQ